MTLKSARIIIAIENLFVQINKLLDSWAKFLNMNVSTKRDLNIGVRSRFSFDKTNYLSVKIRFNITNILSEKHDYIQILNENIKRKLSS